MCSAPLIASRIASANSSAYSTLYVLCRSSLATVPSSCPHLTQTGNDMGCTTELSGLLTRTHRFCPSRLDLRSWATFLSPPSDGGVHRNECSPGGELHPPADSPPDSLASRVALPAPRPGQADTILPRWGVSQPATTVGAGWPTPFHLPLQLHLALNTLASDRHHRSVRGTDDPRLVTSHVTRTLARHGYYTLRRVYTLWVVRAANPPQFACSPRSQAGRLLTSPPSTYNQPTTTTGWPTTGTTRSLARSLAA